MSRLLIFGTIVGGLLALSLVLDGAQARPRRSDTAPKETAGVPELNVKGSCADAQRFSSADDKKLALNGCLQDEMNAKTELGKRWSEFKGKDRSNCVEQSRYPSPSYVEVLTCLEMSSGSFRSSPRLGGATGTPEVGGPVAPGLSKPIEGQPTK